MSRSRANAPAPNAPGGANVPPAPMAIAAPTQQPIFALTPGQYRPDDFIDYGSAQGLKLWNAATEPLPEEFDGTSNTVKIFCELLTQRATEAGWHSGTGNILTIPDSNGIQRNLITNYGQLTLQDVQNHVDSYIQLQTRKAQNAVQMFKCISSSLTEDARLKIVAETDVYTRNGAEAGPILFKLLTQKAVVDTRSTTNYFRENLSSLDTYMASINSNIVEFNNYVKLNRDGLLARGEGCDDLMINLFKGYNAAGDDNFVKYMMDHKTKYDDGEDYTPERLMQLALNKYTNLTRSKQWGALSPEQEKIVALTAEVKTIKDTNLKLSKAIIQASKKGTFSNKSNRDSTKGKGKEKKGSKKKPKIDKKYQWKTIPPKDDDPKKEVNGHSYFYKVVDNLEYYWCQYHTAWVLHEPDGSGNQGCRLRNKQKEGKDESSKTKKSNKSNNSFVSALTTIIEEIQQEEDGQEQM